MVAAQSELPHQKRITLVFCSSKYIVVEKEEQVKKMNSMKFEIDRFSGRNNFNIWKIQMIALLRREGSIHTIDGKIPFTFNLHAL